MRWLSMAPIRPHRGYDEASRLGYATFFPDERVAPAKWKFFVLLRCEFSMVRNPPRPSCQVGRVAPCLVIRISTASGYFGRFRHTE